MLQVQINPRSLKGNPLDQGLVLEHALLKKISRRISDGQNALRWIDLFSAQYVAECHQNAAAKEGDEDLKNIMLLFLYLCSQNNLGYISVDLSQIKDVQIAGFRLPNWEAEDWQKILQISPAVCYDIDDLVIPEREDGQFDFFHDEALSVSPMDRKESSISPLVLSGTKLYSWRYWEMQTQVDTWFEVACHEKILLSDIDWDTIGKQLRESFGLLAQNEMVDWQACAAAQSLTQRICLISGGPGTGKTTTAAKVLELLILQLGMQGRERPVIKLLAPTGKAAIRLYQSIREKFHSDSFCKHLPETGETIHRFLNSVERKSVSNIEQMLVTDDKNKLAEVDILLIDEASMIDLALMMRLIRVIPDHTRVIMMGDHHQLPAVEPGQVFADWVKQYQFVGYGLEQGEVLSGLLRTSEDALSGTGEKRNPVCQLRKTYRFDGDLKQIADLMKDGTSTALIKALEDFELPSGVEESERDVAWCQIESTQLLTRQLDWCQHYFELARQNADLEPLMDQFFRHQILCSTHEGPLGAKAINAFIENHFGVAGMSYHGKAIMVTENQVDLGLFNGDIGFFVEKRPGKFAVQFMTSGEGLIEVAPASIRSAQSAYAITVHKSQGSEYDNLSLIVPGYAKELLSRSLLYTGLTRAKKRAELWFDLDVVDKALS